MSRHPGRSPPEGAQTRGRTGRHLAGSLLETGQSGPGTARLAPLGRGDNDGAEAVLKGPSLKITSASVALAFAPVKDRAPRDRDAAAPRAVLERIESQSSNLAKVLKHS